MAFSGFSADGVALLERLPALDGTRYDEVKALLKGGVVEPGAALIEDVARRLDVPLIVSRRRSVSPLNTDLRFAAAGAPRYKDHLLLTTWHGTDKNNAPTLWIRLDAHSVGFASGIGFTAAIRDRWREAVAGLKGAALQRTLGELGSRQGRSRCEVAGDSLQKVPAPWSEDHERAELLRKKAFQVRLWEPLPSAVTKPSFAPWCVRRLQLLLPVHHWLVANLV